MVNYVQNDSHRNTEDIINFGTIFGLEHCDGLCQGKNKLRNRNEAAHAQLLPMLWPVRQSGAALEPNVAY